jgi:hypothetical protein
MFYMKHSPHPVDVEPSYADDEAIDEGFWGLGLDSVGGVVCGILFVFTFYFGLSCVNVYLV